mmetsp:Transcript_57846/g.91926  ORF Transcript_57846/g.91926 Transcript_57846/m.91926 type:complete len:114 (-) Transcript_57846:433-774(-)
MAAPLIQSTLGTICSSSFTVRDILHCRALPPWSRTRGVNAAEDLANILILASSLQPFSKTLDAMTLHDEFGKMLVRLFACSCGWRAYRKGSFGSIAETLKLYTRTHMFLIKTL